MKVLGHRCEMPRNIYCGYITEEEFYGNTGKKCTGDIAYFVASDWYGLAGWYCPTCTELLKELVGKIAHEGFSIEVEPAYEFASIPDHEGSIVMTAADIEGYVYKNDVMDVAELLDAEKYRDIMLVKLPEVFRECNYMAVGKLYNEEEECWTKFEIPIHPNAQLVFENTKAKEAFADIEKNIKVAVACGYKDDMIKTLRKLAAELEAKP